MRLAIVCLAALLALILSSGTPHAAECSTSYGCGYKEICQNGECIYDALSCKYDSECGAWEYCNTGTYQCARSSGRCVTESDCYGYQYCDANHYCADRQPAGIPGTALNNTTNRSLSDFGSTNPALNSSIQKMKKSVNASIGNAEQQSRGSVGGFFAFFFEFLRKLIFGQ